MTPYTYTKLTCENSLKTATAPTIGWGRWGWLFSPPFSKMALLQLHQQLHPPLVDGAWVVNFKGILPSCHGFSHKKAQGWFRSYEAQNWFLSNPANKGPLCLQIHRTWFHRGHFYTHQPIQCTIEIYSGQIRSRNFYHTFAWAWRVWSFATFAFLWADKGSDPGFFIHPVWANSLCGVKIVLGHPTFLAHCALCVLDQSPDSRSIVCNRHYTNTWSKERCKNAKGQ